MIYRWLINGERERLRDNHRSSISEACEAEVLWLMLSFTGARKATLLHSRSALTDQTLFNILIYLADGASANAMLKKYEAGFCTQMRCWWCIHHWFSFVLSFVNNRHDNKIHFIILILIIKNDYSAINRCWCSWVEIPLSNRNQKPSSLDSSLDFDNHNLTVWQAMSRKTNSLVLDSGLAAYVIRLLIGSWLMTQNSASFVNWQRNCGWFASFLLGAKVLDLSCQCHGVHLCASDQVLRLVRFSMCQLPSFLVLSPKDSSYSCQGGQAWFI